MHEHTFKVGDIEALEAILDGVDWIGTGSTKSGAMERKEAFAIWERIKTKLIPIPATDAEVVERVARHLCEAAGDKWDAKNFNETLTGQEPEENRDGYRGQARDAIAALTSSGYTRSPQRPFNNVTDWASHPDQLSPMAVGPEAFLEEPEQPVNAAEAWLDTYVGFDVGRDHRNDQDYSADQMIDAFMAGMDTRSPKPDVNQMMLEALKKVLTDHWLAEMKCDKTNETNQVRCSCSLVQFPVVKSVGEAASTWVEHVLDRFRAAIVAGSEE